VKPEAPLQWHSSEHVTKSLQRMYKVLRGNVSYGNLNVNDTARNVDGYPVKVTTPGVANTEFPVSHGLNRIPVGFHVMTKNGATDVYQGVTAWTKTQIFLKATGIGINVTLFVF
jgi:hypothetical protein